MPVIGRAGWKMCFNQSEAILVVTCHQYRISALVSQTAFRESQSWRPEMSSKPDKNSLLYFDFPRADYLLCYYPRRQGGVKIMRDNSS